MTAPKWIADLLRDLATLETRQVSQLASMRSSYVIRRLQIQAKREEEARRAPRMKWVSQ